MADYFTQVVVQETIPNADITPLERLLLTQMFSAEPDGDGLYFFAADAVSDMITVERHALESALAQSLALGESHAVAYVAARLSDQDEDDSHIDLDMGGTSWEFFLQDIVRRSTRLHYLTVVASFTCSKMRPDGFGGAATLITAEKILGKSTHDLIAEFLTEAGIDI